MWYGVHGLWLYNADREAADGRQHLNSWNAFEAQDKSAPSQVSQAAVGLLQCSLVDQTPACGFGDWQAACHCMIQVLSACGRIAAAGCEGGFRRMGEGIHI